MKIYKPTGSKERLFEMMEKVNKVQLNEGFGQNYDAQRVLETAFDDLKNKKLNIEHTNTQGSGDKSFIELICKDRQGNDITFTFKTISSAGDQDGVYNVDGVSMFTFAFDDVHGENTVEMDENGLAQFNKQHGAELFDVIQEYITVGDEEPVDTIYEEAIKKIDSYPFGGTPERMQTSKAYGDEKPTNPAVRVKSPQLDKFAPVNEELNPVGQKISTKEELKAYIQQLKTQGIKSLRKEDCPMLADEALYYMAVKMADSMLPMGWEGLSDVNSMWDYINRNGGMTFEKLKSSVKRAVNDRLKEEGYSLKDLGLGESSVEEGVGVSAGVTGEKTFESLPKEFKDRIIRTASEAVNATLKMQGTEKFEIPPELYNKLIRQMGLVIFEKYSADGNMGTSMNETKEKELGDYPDPMGKKFKFKSDNPYPKKKKKPQSVVKISEGEVEDDFDIPDLEIPDGRRAQQQAKNLAKKDMSPELNKKGDDYSQNPEKWSKHPLPYDTQFNLNEKEIEVPPENVEVKSDDNPELSQVEKDNPDVYPDGWKEMDGMFMGPNSPGYGQNDKQVSVPQGEMDGANDPVNFDINQNAAPDNGMSAAPESDEIAQLAQDKEETGEILQGGIGDGKSPLEFSAEQILKGMEVEKEHSSDPMAAIEIVLDHLSEDPEYYTEKDTPEASAQFGASKDADGDDKDLEDILLGFKPHNVGDEIDGDEEKEKPEDFKEPEPEAPEEDDEEKEETEEDDEEKKDIEESEEDKLKQSDPATWHQIQVAKQTIKMPGAMAGVMGGMSKEEARRILAKRGIKISEEVTINGSVGTNQESNVNPELQRKYQEYQKKDFNTLPDNDKEEYFELWKQFKEKK